MTKLKTITVTLGLLCALIVNGCASFDKLFPANPEEVAAARQKFDDAAKTATDLKVQTDAALTVAEQGPWDPKDAEKQARYIAALREKSEKAGEILKAVIAERDALTSGDPKDSIASIGKIASGFIPPPYGLFVGLGTSLLSVLFARKVQTTSAAALEALASVEALKNSTVGGKAGVVNFNDPKSREFLYKVQSPAARRLVDKAKQKAAKLPKP